MTDARNDIFTDDQSGLKDSVMITDDPAEALEAIRNDGLAALRLTPENIGGVHKLMGEMFGEEASMQREPKPASIMTVDGPLIKLTMEGIDFAYSYFNPTKLLQIAKYNVVPEDVNRDEYCQITFGDTDAHLHHSVEDAKILWLEALSNYMNAGME